MSSIALQSIAGNANRNQQARFPLAIYSSTANPAFNVTTAGTQYTLQGTGAWTSDSDSTISAAYSTASPGAASTNAGLTIPAGYEGLWSATAEARWNNTTTTTGVELWWNIVRPGLTGFETGHQTVRGHNTTSAPLSEIYLRAGDRITPIVYSDTSNMTLSYVSMYFQCKKNV